MKRKKEKFEKTCVATGIFDGNRIEIYRSTKDEKAILVVHVDGKQSDLGSAVSNLLNDSYQNAVNSLSFAEIRRDTTYNSDGVLWFDPNADADPTIGRIRKLIAKMPQRDRSAEVFLSDHPQLADVDVSDESAPAGSQYDVIKIEELDFERPFKRIQEVMLTYRLTAPDGKITERTFKTFRKRRHHLETIASLQQFLEDQLKMPILDAAKHWSEEDEGYYPNNPPLEPPILREVFWWLVSHIEAMSELPRVLAPLGDLGAAVRFLISYHSHLSFLLGSHLREAELAADHEKNAVRGSKVERGSGIGGAKSGERSHRHAETWKKEMAVWLQPKIDDWAIGTQDLSRDRIAERVEKNWPEKGFRGLSDQPAQMMCPLRTTLMGILKDLEKNGHIKRPSARRGRKKQS